MTYYAPLIAALVSFLVIAYILSSRLAGKVQDIPNARSLHAVAVPRTGGIGLMAGVLCGWLLLPQAWVWWVVAPLLLLFTVSLLDDVRNLPVRVRLLAHLAAAALLVAGSGMLDQAGWLAASLLLLAAVWMTNLYNFMDGADGLAGGMALFGFAAYAAAAMLAQNESLALANLCIAAGALGFLLHNFPPARIFMGDAGSIPLGFLAAALGLLGWLQDAWPAWFPLLVFSPFVVDASVTLLRRSLRGAKVTEAHREHYYQRAVQLGWSHRNVALVEYALMLAAGLSALAVLQQGSAWLVLSAWAASYGLLMRSIDAAWKGRKGRKGHA